MTEFQEGDLVEAVKGETVIRGRLVAGGTFGVVGLLVPYGWNSIGDMKLADYKVTVIEKATPPLPTEPGLYRSSKADGVWVFHLDRAGDWTLLNTNSLFPIRDGHLERYAPFTRLEPVPVTAKKMRRQILARQFQFEGEQVVAVYSINSVATEFGVTE